MSRIADRVRETTSTTGTGTLTLSGAVAGFRTFSAAFGNGVAVFYAIAGGSEWEVGIGTTGSGTLSRDTVLASSNAGSLVSFAAGSKDVFATIPAGRAALAGVQELYIPAAAFYPRVSNGAEGLAQVQVTAANANLATLNFDAATAENAQCFFALPKSWDRGTLTVRFYWSHATAATNFGVVWGARAVAYGDTDTANAAFGTGVTVTDTGGTANVLYVSADTSAITVAGTPQVGDAIALEVYRDAASGSDTLAVDARLHGVLVRFTTNAPNDL